MTTLQLTIPAQQASRAAVKIRPSQVINWLEDLPYMDLRRAARMASEQLRLMNRQSMPEGARLNILDAFVDSHHRLLDALPARLSEESDIPLQLKRLTQDIGFGYKIVAQSLSAGNINILNNRNLAAAINGSLFNLGIQLTQCYERYRKAPRALWDECLMLFRFARACGLEQRRKAFPGGRIYSIEQVFTLTAALRVADPYAMPGGMVSVIEQYFRKHLQCWRLLDEETEDTRCLPLQLEDTTLTGDFYLDPSRMLEQLREDIHRLEKTGSPVSAGLSDNVPAAHLLHTFKSLADKWERERQRNNERESVHAAIELVSGIEAAYCQINHGRSFDPSLYLQPGQENEIDLARPALSVTAVREAQAPLVCHSQNRSIGGLAIHCPGCQQAHPTTGQLLAIRRADTRREGGWVIAVCRWLVEHTGDHGFDLGLQYLVREPVAAVYRLLDESGFGGEFQPAIAAVQKRNDSPVFTLILAADIAPGSQLELISGRNRQQVVCRERVDSGPGFNRYIYEPCNQA